MSTRFSVFRPLGRRCWAVTKVLTLVGIGYALGVSGVKMELGARAEDAEGGLTKETVNKIQAVHKALAEAMQSMKEDGKYESITDGPNAFLILSGGGNAKADLESNQGVDPETFAALYAGRFLPEMRESFDKDDQQRVTHNGQLVRMYSKARLQKIFAERSKFADTSR